MCQTPYYAKDENLVSIPVPCGKCPECLSRRISGWSFRLCQTARKAKSSNFITLTYDTQHVPITSKGWMSLDKRHVQLFFKRLRKSHVGRVESVEAPIRYYAAGEYGTTSKRPHYHILLFNADLSKIQDAWGMGSVHYGNSTSVNEATAGYTLKYMSKPRLIPMHKNDDRVPEFALMSKGLGKEYLTPQMIAWHKASLLDRMYLNIEDGKKIAMPRYLKDKIYTPLERSEIAGHHKALIEQKETDRHYYVDQDGYLKPKYYSPIEEHNRAQAVQAAFIRMYSRSTSNRDKI